MVGLPPMNWLRFGGWLLLGAVIYGLRPPPAAGWRGPRSPRLRVWRGCLWHHWPDSHAVSRRQDHRSCSPGCWAAWRWASGDGICAAVRAGVGRPGRARQRRAASAAVDLLIGGLLARGWWRWGRLALGAQRADRRPGRCRAGSAAGLAGRRRRRPPPWCGLTAIRNNRFLAAGVVALLARWCVGRRWGRWSPPPWPALLGRAAARRPAGAHVRAARRAPPTPAGLLVLAPLVALCSLGGCLLCWCGAARPAAGRRRMTAHGPRWRARRCCCRGRWPWPPPRCASCAAGGGAGVGAGAGRPAGGAVRRRPTGSNTCSSCPGATSASLLLHRGAGLIALLVFALRRRPPAALRWSGAAAGAAAGGGAGAVGRRQGARAQGRRRRGRPGGPAAGHGAPGAGLRSRRLPRPAGRRRLRRRQPAGQPRRPGLARGRHRPGLRRRAICTPSICGPRPCTRCPRRCPAT